MTIEERIRNRITELQPRIDINLKDIATFIKEKDTSVDAVLGATEFLKEIHIEISQLKWMLRRKLLFEKDIKCEIEKLRKELNGELRYIARQISNNNKHLSLIMTSTGFTEQNCTQISIYENLLTNKKTENDRH